MPLHGELTVCYGNKVIKAGPGRMLYVPPDLDHSFSSSAQGSGERAIWLIEKRLMRIHCKVSFDPNSFPVNSLVKELIFFLLINQKVQGQKYFIAALIETVVESLKAALVFGPSEKNLEHLLGKVSDSRICKALEFMEKDVVLVSLPNVATQAGMSLRNFNRLFLKETGLTPKDFLISKRMDMAKKMLKETNKTVTEISLEVGYNSLSKFIASFKKIVGVLPSDYRS